MVGSVPEDRRIEGDLHALAQLLLAQLLKVGHQDCPRSHATAEACIRMGNVQGAATTSLRRTSHFKGFAFLALLATVECRSVLETG
jgi:hypothetical protein